MLIIVTVVYDKQTMFCVVFLEKAENPKKNNDLFFEYDCYDIQK